MIFKKFLSMKTVVSVLSLAVFIAPALSWADDYPNRPVSLIVPRPPGGAADSILRVLALEASKHLGKPIIVENKPGAAGTLGPAGMARGAKPDGYTVSQMEISMFRMPYLQKVNYDPIKDFTPIIGVAGYVFGVVVRADSPWKTWQDLVAYVKANPGKVTYGSVGVGSTQHIAMGAIADKVGLDWVHVPFKGTSDNLQALLGGHIDVASDSTGWAPYVASGDLRLLVTFGSKAPKKWPDVPILRDVGIDLAFDSPFGISGPAGMPDAVVQKMHDAFKQGMASDKFQELLVNLNAKEIYMSSKEYAQYAERAYKEEGVFLQQLGLKKE